MCKPVGGRTTKNEDQNMDVTDCIIRTSPQKHKLKKERVVVEY
jgi:hypothetical protein